MEVVRYLVVHGHLAGGDVDEVLLDVGESRLEATEGGELFGDAGGEGGGGGVFDVAEEVLDADLFCFFCFDGGGDVEEGFASFCTILWW